MKKFIALVTFATVICANITAETNRTPEETKPVTTTRKWNYFARSQYYGLRLGMALSSGRFYHFDGPKINTEGKAGVCFGFVFGQQIATADVPLFIELGLTYAQKGFSAKFQEKSNATGLMNKYRYKHKMNYLEIPLVLKYKLGEDLTFQPYAGGFLGIGLASNTLVYENPAANKVKGDTFGDKLFERIDAGVRLGCGMAWRNLYLEIAYDFGLVNLCGDGLDLLYPRFENFDESNHSGCFSLSIGVDF